jgi:hypothetical protein
MSTEESWCEYLNRVSAAEDGTALAPISQQVADEAARVREHIEGMEPQLKDPRKFHASVGPMDDGSLWLSFDHDEHHIEIEVHRDLGIEWFYSNRETGLYDGGGP